MAGRGPRTKGKSKIELRSDVENLGSFEEVIFVDFLRSLLCYHLPQSSVMGSPNQRIRRLPTPPDDSRPTPRNLPSANPPSLAPGAPNLAPTATISTSLSDYDLYRARAGSSTVGAESPSEGTGKTRSLCELPCPIPDPSTRVRADDIDV